jgi:hypothetical protein
MALYFDPTESRSSSRLPQAAQDLGRPLAGLEARTGADLFITAYDTPLPDSIAAPPGSLLFARACEQGILVQRKHGADLVHSIPHLTDIQGRMLRHTRLHYLAGIGRFEPTRDGHIAVDGQPTGWLYASYQGALDAWQLRGGQIALFPTEVTFSDWLQRTESVIGKIMSTLSVTPLPEPHTRINGGMFDPIPFRITLATFPGVGPKLAEDIGLYCGSLAHSLWWMTSTDTGIRGVGDGLKRKWRAWLGLQQGEVLLPVSADMLSTVNILPPPPNSQWQAASILASIEAAKAKSTPAPEIHFDSPVRQGATV